MIPQGISNPLDSLIRLCADDECAPAIITAAAFVVAELYVSGRCSTARGWILSSSGSVRAQAHYEREGRRGGAMLRAWATQNVRALETLVSCEPTTVSRESGECDGCAIRAESFGDIRSWGADIVCGQLGPFYTLTSTIPHVERQAN